MSSDLKLTRSTPLVQKRLARFSVQNSVHSLKRLSCLLDLNGFSVANVDIAFDLSLLPPEKMRPKTRSGLILETVLL